MRKHKHSTPELAEWADSGQDLRDIARLKRAAVYEHIPDARCHTAFERLIAHYLRNRRLNARLRRGRIKKGRTKKTASFRQMKRQTPK
ncbi:MAG: hypothetical protein FWD23_15895 [Oscillospiraceae bacterium]|nr:hypothetical protein [Oscillospiraceae bacterium]